MTGGRVMPKKRRPHGKREVVTTVTEAEWLACTDPKPMLEFLRGRASDRKLRLFACGCCRRLWDVLASRRPKHWPLVVTRWRKAMVEGVERYVDGVYEPSQVKFPIGGDRHTGGGDWLDWVAGRAAQVEEPALPTAVEVSEYACEARRSQVLAELAGRLRPSSGAVDDLEAAAAAAERATQCQLLRDIFGNPFRPVALDPVWAKPGVVKLAQAIYDKRAFDKLPKLADALAKAGCDDADILAHCLLTHCRQPGEHVRGCWVVDLILGKE
jgi:hypothetical protein